MTVSGPSCQMYNVHVLEHVYLYMCVYNACDIVHDTTDLCIPVVMRAERNCLCRML